MSSKHKDRIFRRIEEITGMYLTPKEIIALVKIFPDADFFGPESEEEDQEMLEIACAEFRGAAEYLWMALKITEQQMWDLEDLLDDIPEIYDPEEGEA